MSKRNIAVSLLFAAALIAAPAYADGKDRPKPKGPEPLRPTTTTVTPPTYTTPTVTRTYTPAPTYYAPQPVAAAAPTFDFSGFNGGVGANVGGGYYGGGGGFIIDTRPAFSGVLSSPAAAFTFNKRVIARPPRPHPRPGHGCGC